METVILCEVLELDANAMLAMSVHERSEVMEEAKRNITKWPDLNDLQRVAVNRALVKLRITRGHREDEDYLEECSFDEEVEPRNMNNRYLTPNSNGSLHHNSTVHLGQRTFAVDGFPWGWTDGSCSNQSSVAKDEDPFIDSVEFPIDRSDGGTIKDAVMARRYPCPRPIIHKLSASSSVNSSISKSAGTAARI